MKDEKEQILAARVPKDLIKRLDRAAKAGHRSRSAEMRVRLEQSLKAAPVLGMPAPIAAATPAG
jgi:metal-responsive CopG/Arc/MetJ family transcriptional regulator